LGVEKSGALLMTFLKKIKARARRLFQKEMDPARAYDRWASTYDAQPGNLMLALDEALFSLLLTQVDCSGKWVVDIGCGTGRHWQKILNRHPAKLIGYDVSPQMLLQLQLRYPGAQTQLIVGNKIHYSEPRPAGVLVTTLALAHIKKLGPAMQQWNKILKPGADILITDYHPETLALGGDRTFLYQGKITAIQNYVHSIDQVKTCARENDFELLTFTERRIDPDVKPWYEKQGALGVYHRFEGAGIIYGMHLRKRNAAP
jgi:ubiquinone/menaquinone biosynthesis C-methylase UbiE